LGENELYACLNRSAILLSAFSIHAKGPLINVMPSWPQNKIKSDAAFGGKTLYNNCSFINFTSPKTFCGTKQVIFKLNEWSADYIPMVQVTYPKFIVSFIAEIITWSEFIY
jgi:hypothetical protein